MIFHPPPQLLPSLRSPFCRISFPPELFHELLKVRRRKAAARLLQVQSFPRPERLEQDAVDLSLRIAFFRVPEFVQHDPQFLRPVVVLPVLVDQGCPIFLHRLANVLCPLRYTLFFEFGPVSLHLVGQLVDSFHIPCFPLSVPIVLNTLTDLPTPVYSLLRSRPVPHPHHPCTNLSIPLRVSFLLHPIEISSHDFFLQFPPFF
uniref:Uncharacterized protein n=1 Tax=Cacopsylla melanoneura TaxID=428564 RepID=A0A8D9BB77_9HEMI